jgi:hypothetical protein
MRWLDGARDEPRRVSLPELLSGAVVVTAGILLRLAAARRQTRPVGPAL